MPPSKRRAAARAREESKKAWAHEDAVPASMDLEMAEPGRGGEGQDDLLAHPPALLGFLFRHQMVAVEYYALCPNSTEIS